MKNSYTRFIVRWFVCGFGLWIAAEILGEESISIGGGFGTLILSGLVLALVNTIVRPLMVFLTLPAVLLSLGIFMAVINACMVLLASWWYGPLEVSGFGIALITGMVIGLVNWLVSALLEEKNA